MFQYLALTDGSTTVELTDTIDYALVSYAPGIAPLRDSELGGEGAYDDVVDTLTFHAMGCTAADAYAAAAAVNQLLDQARRWWLGGNVGIVSLLIQAQESALSALQVAVKGRAPGSGPNMSLQATWSESHGKYTVQNISIQFQRRGLLVQSSEALTIAAGANPSATVVSANFASNTSKPCYLSLSATNISAQVASVSSCYLLWHKTAANLQILEAEAIPDSGTGLFSVVADAANHARGGSVLRFAGSTGLSDWVSQNPLILTTSCYRAVIYAAVRANATTKTFGIRVNCMSKAGSSANNDPSSATTYWRATTANNPEIIPIGIVSVMRGIGAITIQCSSEVVTTERLDIDYLILLGIDDEQSGVLGLTSWQPFDVVITTPLTDQLALDMLFNPTADTIARVQLRNATTGAIAAKTYSGDPVAQHSGQNLTCCILGCTGTHWRIYDATAAALDFIGFDATRYLTAFVPI